MTESIRQICACIAVPIYDADGGVVAALSVRRETEQGAGGGAGTDSPGPPAGSHGDHPAALKPNEVPIAKRHRRINCVALFCVAVGPVGSQEAMDYSASSTAFHLCNPTRWDV